MAIDCRHGRPRIGEEPQIGGAVSLEGIVAKLLADACHPKLARRHKVLIGPIRSAAGGEWFCERRGRYAGRRVFGESDGRALAARERMKLPSFRCA
jgi:hypothetical protein